MKILLCRFNYKCFRVTYMQNFMHISVDYDGFRSETRFLSPRDPLSENPSTLLLITNYKDISQSLEQYLYSILLKVHIFIKH